MESSVRNKRKRELIDEPDETFPETKKSNMGGLFSKKESRANLNTATVYTEEYCQGRAHNKSPQYRGESWTDRNYAPSAQRATTSRSVECSVNSTQDVVTWDVAEVLASTAGVQKPLAYAFVKLLTEGNTLPFIARYRKAMVGYLMPDKLQELFEYYQTVTELRKKAKTALENLKKSNKLTKDVEKSIINARSLPELELVYNPLKSQTVTLAQKARDLGLESPAIRLLNAQHVDILNICNPRKEELSTHDKVETHIIHIIADIIYKDPKVLEHMMMLKEETNFSLESTRTKSSMKPKDDNKKIESRADPDTYKLYFEFRCAVQHIKQYQVLAINRGEDEKILSVKVIVPDWFYNKLEKFCLQRWKGSLYVKKALTDGYTRLIKPWLSRQVRSQLTAAAQKEAIKTFSANLEKLLLTEPTKNRCIAGLDPGFRAGCKVGIISCNGEMLHACTIHPDLRSNSTYDRAAYQLEDLLKKHNVEVIGLGNGTACRETESWLSRHNISKYIPVVIVPEQGASIYSVSAEATKEHPNMDPNHISALSIARRVLDPLGELVKVEPKHLGVGMYQHDIPEKMLESALTSTLETVVSLVGADLNTASHALLKRIAGLKENQVKNIIAYRQKNGRFTSRAELMKVSGVGKITYEQCAGFLRVLGGPEPLDSTIIHPESYSIAKKFAQKLALNLQDINESFFPELAGRKVGSVDMLSMMSYLGTDEGTLDVIISAFKRISHEATISFGKPIYSVNVQATEQLKTGMTVTGVVRNVVQFGCFVDCGVGHDGLIHRKQMGGNQTPKLGDRVSVKVLSTPKPKRIELKLIEVLNQ